MIDQVYNHRAKPTANKQADVGVVSYKWHWQTKPQVIKSMGHEIFAWNDDKEKQHQKNNKQNNKQIKEEYSMDMFERDPSILKMIMESENDSEDNNTKPEGEGVNELNITIEDDGDGDAIGIDDSNEQNQYDPKEVETLNKLIASEADAISDYFEAGKATRVPVLSKLYSDIGEEERFHIEQLLYAKSTVTGEKYEPRDPKVREEYNELLELGMDEETAMTTAVDKLSISVSEEDLTANESEEIKESFTMINGMSRFVSLAYDVLLESVMTNSDIKESLYTEYTNFFEEAYVMEEVDNLNKKSSQRDLGTSNPIKIVMNAFRAVYKLIISLVRKAKLAFQKVRLKDKRRWAWINKHGIKGLFQSGVHLYFYSDKRDRYEVGQALTFLEMVHEMNVKIINGCKLNVNPSKYDVEGFMQKLSNVEKSPIDSKTIIQRIKGSSINDGVKDLQGMMLTKTKLIITDNNEAYFEKLFFGYTSEKYKLMATNEDGSKAPVSVSENIYNQLDIALSALENVGNETNEVVEALDRMQGQGGVYSSNPKYYNDCVRAASQMTRSIDKFIGAVSHDITEIFKINTGLKEAVEKADQTGGRDKSDMQTWANEKTEQIKAYNDEKAQQAKVNQSKYSTK
jgi:hypothetical protein